MAWAAAIPAAIGGIASLVGAANANKANEAMAREQMTFQGAMSDTAHRREVYDLKMAGLNPILSANGGASSPSGASAQMQNEIGPAVTTAMEAMRVRKELQQADSNMALQQVQGQAALAGAAKDTASAKVASEQATNTAMQNVILSNEIPSAKQKAINDLKEQQYRTKFMDADQIMMRGEQGLGLINKAKDLVNPLNGVGKKLPKGLDVLKDGSVFKKSTGEIIHERGR